VKRKVRCEHSDNISKCPACWAEFTGENDDDLRQKIESLQFTLMTPSPVTVTLGESKLTDDIMHLIAAHHTTQTVALLEELRKKAEVIPVLDGHGFGLATRVGVVPLAVLDDEIARLKGDVTE
jgi:hypothetical protein